MPRMKTITSYKASGDRMWTCFSCSTSQVQQELSCGQKTAGVPQVVLQQPCRLCSLAGQDDCSIEPISRRANSLHPFQQTSQQSVPLSANKPIVLAPFSRQANSLRPFQQTSQQSAHSQCLVFVMSIDTMYCCLSSYCVNKLCNCEYSFVVVYMII